VARDNQTIIIIGQVENTPIHAQSAYYEDQRQRVRIASESFRTTAFRQRIPGSARGLPVPTKHYEASHSRRNPEAAPGRTTHDVEVTASQ
jgi:hypothetical protein